MARAKVQWQGETAGWAHKGQKHVSSTRHHQEDTFSKGTGGQSMLFKGRKGKHVPQSVQVLASASVLAPMGKMGNAMHIGRWSGKANAVFAR